jgi:hypothetical protein
MKAKLEPRMVAARIHFPDDFEHDAAMCPDRITPSSHGSRIKVVIVAAAGFHDKF